MKKWIAAGLTAALLMSFAAFAELPEPSALEVQNQEAASAAETAADDAEGAQSDQTVAQAPVDPSDAPVSETDGQDEASTAATGTVSALDALPDPEEVIEMTAQAGGETHTVWFDEGFGLDVPEGWVSYRVSEEDRAKGVRYALGDGSGEHYLYIQIESTGLHTAAELAQAVDGEDGLDKTGNLVFGGTDFVAFIDSAQNASCCATIWGNRLVMFVFTPQTDADYMMTATQLMETFVTV